MALGLFCEMGAEETRGGDSFKTQVMIKCERQIRGPTESRKSKKDNPAGR